MLWQKYNKDSFNFKIDEDDIHIWLISFNIIQEQTIFFKKLLSQDELSRAGRFHFEIGAKKYISGRGMLRLLLANYLSVLPASISFIYNAFGKPELEKNKNSMLLNFNLSHAGSYLIIGLSNIVNIGIDIEIFEQKTDLIDIAKKFFSDNEYIRINSLPEEKQVEAFYSCWTRKEAFIKAVGEGLSFPLKSFDVDTDLGEGEKSIIINKVNEIESYNWSLLSLKPATNYVGALAVNKKMKSVKALMLDNYLELVN
jgi:4'-phosphopantetheinyl transferase